MWWWFDWLVYGLTSRSTILKSCWDGATASWVFTSTFGSLKCLAQGHFTTTVGFKPGTSSSGVRCSTTRPPSGGGVCVWWWCVWGCMVVVCVVVLW